MVTDRKDFSPCHHSNTLTIAVLEGRSIIDHSSGVDPSNRDRMVSNKGFLGTKASKMQSASKHCALGRRIFLLLQEIAVPVQLGGAEVIRKRRGLP